MLQRAKYAYNFSVRQKIVFLNMAWQLAVIYWTSLCTKFYSHFWTLIISLIPYHYPVLLGFPCGSAGKEFACSAGDLGSIPGLGRYPGEGKVYPLQYSCLAGYNPWGRQESDTAGWITVLILQKAIRQQQRALIWPQWFGNLEKTGTGSMLSPKIALSEMRMSAPVSCLSYDILLHITSG